MTPTHLSMSHEGKETLRQLTEGLEGVTPGPWLEDGRYVFIDTRRQVCCGRGVEVGCPEGGSMLECCGNPDVEGDYHAIAEGGENNKEQGGRPMTLPLLLALPRILGEWGR